MTRARTWRTLLLLAPLLAASGTARADDLSELEGILSEPVVTTASESAETSTNAPATSTTLTAEDIRRYGIHSIAEAIDFLSLGVVTANPLGPVDIGARGVMFPRDFGDHFLLLVNGHAVNEPLFGTAHFDRGAGIPMEMVDHIEVILGPGSVLYGSNAMLGVINVITKRAKDWHGTHVVGETEVSRSEQVGGGSRYEPTWYRAAAGAGYDFKLFGTPSEATVGLEYQTQSGPNFFFPPFFGGNDPLTGTGYRFNRNGPQNGIWGGVADGTYWSRVPAGHLRLISGNLELNVHASEYDRSIPYRSRFDRPYNDFDEPGHELDRSLWGDLKYRLTLTPVLQVTARVYGDSFDYQDHAYVSQIDVCRYQSATTCDLNYDGASRWVGSELQLSFDWFKDARFVTLIGADGRLRYVRTRGEIYDVYTQRPLVSSFALTRENDRTLGTYIEQTWQAARWLGFNAGARYDTEDRFTGQVSPRVATTVHPWKGGTLKAIYAEAFRAPSYQETNFSSPNEVPAGPLSPERVRSVEGSIEEAFGTQKLLFGAFRSWWTNMVEVHFLTPAETAQAAQQGLINEFLGSEFAQYRNVSSIDNYGFNAAYSGQTENGALRYGLNVTGAYARRFVANAPPLPLNVTPELFGNARISYDLPGLLPTLGVVAQYMSKRPADLAFIGTYVPEPYAPPQLDLRGTISGDVPGLKGLSYRLWADYAFATQGPYVVGPLPPAPMPAELVPVDQFRAGIGLQYDLFR